MARFAGEEVLKTLQYDQLLHETVTQLRRVSDNALILDAGKNSVAVSRAGGSVCIYKDSGTEKFTPVLLLDSEPAALIRKAKKCLEVKP